MKTRTYSSLAAVALFAIASLAAARADENTNSIKFSDPAKPGTLKISLGRGDLQVQGADSKEISVKSEAKAITAKPRKDGLRVISASSSFALSEKDNVVTLDAAMDGMFHGSSDMRITVPRNTTIIVQNAWGGDFAATNISGDIELNSMRGDIRLDEISGGVVVGTMNGEIRANIRELHDGKPISFTSMNGEVVLRLPENAKANVRLRTQNGSVMTDFDDNVLVTKTESAPYTPRGKNVTVFRGNKGLNVDIQEAIREATQVSALAIRQALESVKEGLDSARLDSEDARRQLEDARRQLEDFERERRDSERAQRDAARAAGRRGDDVAPAAPATPATPATPASPAAAPRASAMPMLPKVAIPTMSGGKLVTGTLNGGGPEISVATMNGDVTLRRLEAKK